MKQPTTSTLTLEQYHAFSKLLHWLMAILMIAMLAFGLLLGEVPQAWRGFAYGLHKSTGILILMLVAVRILWRLVKPAPAMPADFSTLVKYGAHGAHLTLYALMILMPLSGWWMSTVAGRSVEFYGLFTLPPLGDVDPEYKDYSKAVHTWIGYALIALISLHAGAALWHHFIRKDATLRRTLPHFNK